MKTGRRLGADSIGAPGSNTPAPARHIQGIKAPPMPVANIGAPLREISSESSDTHSTSSPPSELKSVVANSLAFAQADIPAPLLIPIDLIDPSPYQPRLKFDDATIMALADTIVDAGLNNPIIVRQKANGRFELIAGERRFRAHKLLRVKEIPALVRVLSDAEAALLATTDNDAREDLTDFERGRSYASLLENKIVDNQSELARRVGRSMSMISRCLSYLRLPKEVISMLEEDPSLIGTRVVADFVKHTEKHAELVCQAAMRIRDQGNTQETALNWLKGKVNKANSPESPMIARNLRLNGDAIAEAKIEGRTLHLKCTGNMRPEALLEMLQKLTAPPEAASESTATSAASE